MKNAEKNTLTFVSGETQGLYNLGMLEEMEDNEYLQEVLTIWLMESPKDIKDIQEALQAGKIDIACKKAHKLKGSAVVIQAENLKAILEHIEQRGKSGATVDELQGLVNEVSKEYNSIESSLKRYIEGLNKKIA
ncbi:MAG TPA: Hpt domain-containing protein [Ferruginibacter sp.]|nr:Hpt domain-containing protein [Ferruginibacter sp.]